MTVMLDTHMLLWAALGSDRLPAPAAAMINDPSQELVFSAANIWEVVIKGSLGRKDFRVNPHTLRMRLLENGYAELAISSEHTLAVANLPDLHKDPFDRILIAQAQIEKLPIMTADPQFRRYQVKVLT